jgi:hypothetical protein
MSEPLIPRLPDRQHRTAGREIGIPEGVGRCQWVWRGFVGLMAPWSLVVPVRGRASSRSRGQGWR